MSETVTTTCDGCGGVIDTEGPHLALTIHRLLEFGSPGRRRLSYRTHHDLHGINCIPAWLEKMPAEVRSQFRYRDEARCELGE